MTNLFWSEFGILFAASLVGGLAVLPYGMKLLSAEARSKLKMPLPIVLLLSFLQTAVLFAVVTGLGLLAAHAIGLGAPLIEAPLAGSLSSHVLWTAIPTAAVLGAIAGAMLLLAD